MRITQGRSTIDELAERLRSIGPVSARLMMRRSDEGLRLVTGLVDAGGDTAGFEEVTYDYGRVAFAKAVLDGFIVADWLTSGSGEVDGLEFPLPELSPDFPWELTASRASGRYGTRLTVPHTEYSLSLPGQTEPPSHGTLLAGARLPFFLDERAAVASALLDDHSVPAPNRSIPTEGILVRIAHPEAYIDEVSVSSAAITVSVRGEDLERVHLQVSSAGQRHEEPVSKPREVTAPISGADRADAWVALVRGDKCLDVRTISNRWPARREQQGIVYETDELDERLDRLRLGGESETVEFKEDFPEGDGIARAVAAFANGRGGTLIMGIRDDGEVAGIDDVTTAPDRLHNIVRNNVSPHPDYQVSEHTLGGRPVVAIRVEPGDDRPYGVGRNRSGPRYYVRRGANNFVAQPEEMRVISQPRQPRSRGETDDYRLLP